MKPEWRKKLEGLQNISWQWVGRTHEGVTKWRGNRHGPPPRMARMFRIYGACAGGVGLVGLAEWLAMPPHAVPGIGTLAFVGLIHGVVFSAIGLWMDHVRKSLARLQSAEELAQQMGLDAEAVRQLAAQKAIRPRINVNADDLYDPDSFVDSVSLLRGASAPLSPDTLVRPAMPEASPTHPETLLRAAVPRSEPSEADQLDLDKVYGHDEADPQRLLRR